MLIAQFRGTGFPSNVIRWITRGPYSHTAFVADENTQAAGALIRANDPVKLGGLTQTHAGSVIEAWLPKVRNVGSLAEGHTRGTVVDLFALRKPLALDEEGALLEWLGGEIGWPYDWLDVVRFITKRPGNLDKSWFCSELNFAGLARVGRVLFALTQAWEVPPSWIQRSPILRYQRSLTI